jgi:hypothetical protein
VDKKYTMSWKEVMQMISSSSKKDTQSRAYQLTINNPTEKGLNHDSIKKIIKAIPSLDYYCLCDEIGEEGTPHTHVYLKVRNPIKFSTMKNKFPTAHIEAAKGDAKENRDYIRKEGKYANTRKAETNLPDTFEEEGELPVNRQGERTDWQILYDMISDGCSDKEIIEANPGYIRFLSSIDRARQKIWEDKFKDEWRNIECIYIYGKTNTNKTRSVMEKYGYGNVFRMTNYHTTGLWDAYKCQDVVVFEEFRSQLDISDMLTYMEGYPNSSLRARYSDKCAVYTKIVIISNIPLECQYPDVQEEDYETWKAFLRRIKRVYYHESRTKVHEYNSVREYMLIHQKERDFQAMSEPVQTPFDTDENETMPFD